jgi:hypothetical protein
MKKIYIPENLDLRNHLGNISDKKLDIYHYLIHLIYEQRVLYKNLDDYIPLKALYLRRIINEKFEEYRDTLVDIGVIDCDRVYVKNRKSFGYKLLPPYSEVKHKEIELRNACILRNIEKWKARRLPTTDVHMHLYYFLNNVDIDHEAALLEIGGLPAIEYNYAKIAIDKFKNKDFFLYSDDYGRVHTNITSLKSTLRRFLSYKKEKLVNIDVINSQPLLLFLLPSIRCAFSNVIENFEMDILDYKDLVESGKLYDFLMEGEVDRGAFKEMFFRETFFGKTVSKKFRFLFPSIAKYLLEIKKKDYRRLAWMMQKAESNLVINRICRRLMNEYKDAFITTIHDSIMTTEQYVEDIKKVMLEEFKEFDLSPSIRIESA